MGRDRSVGIGIAYWGSYEEKNEQLIIDNILFFIENRLAISVFALSLRSKSLR